MSMLRNVLTYMGLGPDEDYDDGYLYDTTDTDIDLTDGAESSADTRVEEEQPVKERPSRLGGASSSRLGAAASDRGGDPHAQRARPDWLSPPPPPDASVDSARRKIAIDDEDPDHVRPARGRHDFDPRDDGRPLRAVPPAPADETDSGVTVRAVPAERPEPDTGATTAPAGPEPRTEGIRFVKPRALSPTSFGDAKILADDFKAQVPVIMNLQGIERDLARRLIDFASGICYALDGSMEKIASQVFLLTPQEVEVSDEDRRRMEQRGYDG